MINICLLIGRSVQPRFQSFLPASDKLKLNFDLLLIFENKNTLKLNLSLFFNSDYLTDLFFLIWSSSGLSSQLQKTLETFGSGSSLFCFQCLQLDCQSSEPELNLVQIIRTGSHHRIWVLFLPSKFHNHQKKNENFTFES